MRNWPYIEMPADVCWILDQLHGAGYEAYIVGGCVRDSILLLIPHDWDICTSAKPDEILDVFKTQKTIQTGIKYGTITLVLDNKAYEITTYRIDGKYSDGRHPDKVEYTSALTEDLGRRDFTINAMAYNDEDGLVDPFQGLKDLCNKTLRCVGSACDRFAEDELRRFRAIRFALKYQLTFDPDLETNLLLKCGGRLSKLSSERVQSEVTRILELYPLLVPSLEHAYNLFAALQFLLVDHFPGQLYRSALTPVYEIYRQLMASGDCLSLKLAILFRKEDNVEAILRHLKYSNKVIHKVLSILALLDDPLMTGVCVKKTPSDYRITQRILQRYPPNIVIHVCDFYSQLYPEVLWFRVLASQVSRIDPAINPYQIAHLKINGNDLQELGIHGKDIGKMLQHLLDKCIMGQVKNNREDLLRITNDCVEMIPNRQRSYINGI